MGGSMSSVVISGDTSGAITVAAVTAQAEADAQAVIDTRTSALAKLAALGLTQDEVKALVG
jgi:hypothetical protein